MDRHHTQLCLLFWPLAQPGSDLGVDTTIEHFAFCSAGTVALWVRYSKYCNVAEKADLKVQGIWVTEYGGGSLPAGSKGRALVEVWGKAPEANYKTDSECQLELSSGRRNGWSENTHFHPSQKIIIGFARLNF